MKETNRRTVIKWGISEIRDLTGKIIHADLQAAGADNLF
jgi:hypothetical protein